jgi:DNA-3-methyladenine glycosylase I
MTIQVFKDEQLAEIYRRGRRTANLIDGRDEDSGLVYKPSAKPRDLQRYKDKRPDAVMFRNLALYPFFGGMKSSTVEKHRVYINKWFWDYREVAKYSEKEFDDMMADPQMIHNKNKIQAAIDNARKFESVLNDHGSFIEYIFSFKPHDSMDNLKALVRDFKVRFDQYGTIITEQYLKDVDIGLPLIKADLNIVRTFCRIGLIEGDCSKRPFKPTNKMEEDSKEVASKIAKAASVPVSWVDALVGLGMETGREVCGNKTFCERPENPCKIRELCNYWFEHHEA